MIEDVFQDYAVLEKNGKQFIAVSRSKDIFEGRGKQIKFKYDDDLQVAIFRIKNNLYCLSNICPHRHADQIYNGILTEMTVVCPMHGWTYSIETGLNVNPQQGMRSLKKYEIFEEDGTVYIEPPGLDSIPQWRKNIVHD